ncbi:MAG TPA: N,N-dimethylformamidase beta subunit family domain-containing protein, partial [Acidimicrobiia bacterium]
MPDRIFSLDRWATLAPAAGWVIGAGRFHDAIQSDLLAYRPSNGTLWVGRNDGGVFTFTAPWATVSPPGGWQFTTGDVTGNGRSDVIGYQPGNGTVWVGENRGGTFEFRQWATLSPAQGWQIAAGFFTGKAKVDLLALHAPTGTLWVGENVGAAFVTTSWGALAPGQGWQLTAADCVGDGRTDAVAHNPGDGSVWVGENHGSGFVLSQWVGLQPASGWQIAAGRFTGRDKADLFAYHSGNGSLWVGENTGAGFTFSEPWATVAPTAGWQFAAGSFDGNLWEDAVGYHPTDGPVWVARSTLRPIEGYCWPLSAAPGEQIAFRLSGTGDSVATIQRHTSVSAAVDSVQVLQVPFVASRQPVPDSPWRFGCGWPDTFTLMVQPDWGSGIYSASCTDAEGGTCDITFVVKPAPAARAGIAVLANANTWLAYNGWGGQSKYSGLARTSFLRPMPASAPRGDQHLTRGELWILGWLEREGFGADVYSDLDFHNDGCDAAQYACLIVGTHPEYWTTQMYDNASAYLDAGGSLLYLAGNGVFEIGEYDNDQTEMLFRNGIEGGPRENALFRVQGRPERSLLGVATERCGVVGSPFVVQFADHELFAGTGVTNGTIFGNAGLNTGFGNGKASAWEVDTSNGPGSMSTAPADCAMTPQAVPPSILPAGLTRL